MDPRRPLLAAAGLAFAVGLPARALAQSGGDTPAPFTLIDEDAEIGQSRPLAADTRTGHLYLQPRFGVVAPVGKLAAAPDTSPTAGTATSQLAGTGMGFGGTLGVGISRHATIEVVGQYTRFGAPSACDGCKGSSVDVGLGLTYHLAQGIAVDPWISYGFGVRFATFTAHPTSATGGPTSGTPVQQPFRGIDVARLSFGADFYPVPAFGIGPYLEADIGTDYARPRSANVDAPLGAGIYGFLQVGVRIAFDPFQRSVATRPASPKASAHR